MFGFISLFLKEQTDEHSYKTSKEHLVPQKINYQQYQKEEAGNDERTGSIASDQVPDQENATKGGSHHDDAPYAQEQDCQYHLVERY